MNENGSEQNAASDQAEESNQCGPGCSCNCGSTGSGNKWKTIISLAIIVAAAVVLARGFAHNAESKASQVKKSFTTAAPVTNGATEKVKAQRTNQVKSSPWGEPLKGMASLNEVAADTTAVFVYLAERGQKPSKAIKRNIERAADKSKSKGMAVSFYMLDDSSEDYAQITSQTPAPCVLVMAKGCGASAVSGDITEEKLLAAIVAASRPSSCGPSGCGPSSSDMQGCESHPIDVHTCLARVSS